MEPKISILTLGVEDLERSFAFYHDGLGWTSKGIVGKEFEHGEVVFFDLPHGMKLALYARENLAWDAMVPKQPSSATEFSIGYMVESEAEVNAIMELAKNAGARITKPAQKAFWGGYHGYFQDPDGIYGRLSGIRKLRWSDAGRVATIFRSRCVIAPHAYTIGSLNRILFPKGSVTVMIRVPQSVEWISGRW